MKVAIEVSPAKIADMMVSAIETSNMTRAWCSEVDIYSDVPAGDGPWYSLPQFYKPGMIFLVQELLDDGTHKNHRVTWNRLKAGVQWMAEHEPRHFADWMSGDDDGVTADVFLQSVVFQEVKYG